MLYSRLRMILHPGVVIDWCLFRVPKAYGAQH